MKYRDCEYGRGVTWLDSLRMTERAYIPVGGCVPTSSYGRGSIRSISTSTGFPRSNYLTGQVHSTSLSELASLISWFGWHPLFFSAYLHISASSHRRCIHEDQTSASTWILHHQIHIGEIEFACRVSQRRQRSQRSQLTKWKHDRKKQSMRWFHLRGQNLSWGHMFFGRYNTGYFNHSV